jgi:hypothetical protein
LYLPSNDGILIQYGKLFDQLRGGAQLSDLLRDFFNHINKFGSFSRGNPGEMETAWFYAHMFNEIFEEGEFSPGIIITFQVMAVSRVST